MGWKWVKISCPTLFIKQWEESGQTRLHPTHCMDDCITRTQFIEGNYDTILRSSGNGHRTRAGMELGFARDRLTKSF